MPFRRLRRRHTVIGGVGSAGAQGLPQMRSAGSIHEPGYLDPVAEMQKRKADEETKAMQRMTSDILSYCFHLLRSLLSLILALVYYNAKSLKTEEDEELEEEEDEEEVVVEETSVSAHDTARQRYNKVVVATNVVDMFNSHGQGCSKSATEDESHDELMKLLEEKPCKFPTPTADLLNSDKNSGKISRGQSAKIDLNSMMYLS